VRVEKPDLIILDLGLPEMDWIGCDAEIRKHSNADHHATARSEERWLIRLELPRMTITKPFSPKELVSARSPFPPHRSYTECQLEK
jgi:DNA-binding response OmpR family regulator